MGLDMATHKLGKLKFNLSKQGLAYKWGDGEVHRLNFGKKQPSTENEYDNYEEYAEDEVYSDVGFDDEQAYDEQAYAGEYDEAYEDEADGYGAGYAGDYADDPGYDDGYDDGYADEEAYDEAGYDEEYDEAAYDEEGYDDDYADDYEDGYEGEYEDYDDGYDGEYDDRYSDEDAGEAYDDEYYGEGENGFFQYVDENAWVMYLLLFLLPPLGIYLLWRSNRFENLIRYILTAASAIWFVIALILLFSGLFGGRGDEPVNVVNLPSASPTVIATPVPTPTAVPVTEPEVSPSPTPLGGSANTGNSGTSGSSDYVYSPSSGLYYHSSNTCANIGAGVSTSRISVEIAQSSRNQSACPLCYTGSSNTTMYYATRGGTYYHADKNCSSMKNATTYTKQAAEKAGKKACPVCVTKIQKSLETEDVKIITSSTKDKSNITVYATKGGTYFHMTSDCSGMKGATKGSLKNALLAGKKACPTCCKVAATQVYCTEGGTYYHLKDNCSGMKNALNVTLAEALVLGKQRCKDCIKKSLTAGTGSASSSNTVYVYGTKNGQYYHTVEDCSGMANAQKYTLKSMIVANRQACPKCASSAGTKVYAKQGGTYYHSYATCSGMSNATQGTMAQALAYGFKRCPKCWSTGSSSSGSSTTSSGINTGSKTKVYATEGGTYYHTDKDCSGMKNASSITLATAAKYNKKPCPTCASAAKRTVYSTDSGKYYHTDSDCSGMKNAEKRTLQAALLLDQKACPECVGTSSGASSSSGSSSSGNTYKSGTSGVKVYATKEGTYYHTVSDCSGMKNASKITLETALNYGKKACTTCASNAARTVYATKSGKYYHASKSCAGSGAKSGTVGEAVAYGYDPCPYCVSKTSSSNASSDSYKSGTSGVKVYATINGKYFHRESDCSGMEGASLVTLETAMNYGKTGCPKCFSSANKTVYAKANSKYYHYTKSCAGSGALAGTLAKARALGMSPCSKCTSSSSSSGSSSSGSISSTGKKYSAAANSSVYIDLSGSNYYYHKAKKCSTTGVSGATKVTLQYVKDLGYKACPYCEPPTSISKGDA